MFTSAAEALDWAYNTEARSIINPSAVNGMIRARLSRLPNDLLTNLSPLEAHGQAAQIIGIVEKLSYPSGREYIAARFGCRLERADLRHVVYDGCASLGMGMEKQETVYKIVRAYFRGNGVSARVIRREFGCRHFAAVMAKSCLYDVLDHIHDHAMAEITGELEKRELIESTCYA